MVVPSLRPSKCNLQRLHTITHHLYSLSVSLHSKLLGSKTITCRSFKPLNAFSICGRTSPHGRPPSPQPSGGIAIDWIFRFLISSVSASSPAFISSIRLLPRQCLLVGKLIIYFGSRLESKSGSWLVSISVTNIRPGRTSPRLHASA